MNVLKYFFENIGDYKIKPFGSGLIHRTFFLEHEEGEFIVQKMNAYIFKNPKVVMQNIQTVAHYLQQKNYPKAVLEIRPTLSGDLFFQKNKNEFWRIFKYISDTHVYSKAETERQVYETGKSFGEFLFFLKDLPTEKIKSAIPDFHNTQLRWEQMKKTIKSNAFGRAERAATEIEKIKNWYFLIQKFEQLDFPKRVIHADAKMSNLLFDKNKKVVAVIDWDTIMVGNVLYDFGDLVRTMTCELDEESTDFENVKISMPYFAMLTKGFLEATDSWLSEVEKNNLLLGAKMIIYEQAIRFLTDFLDGDKYYSTTYVNQNLNRTKNQIALLEDIFEKQKQISK
ncbi:MAG TPA: aminoglycoside phosphotransferase family protein [Phaeodactylibacter sp.]|nr:aminoglycoside phosphotransferase family protein [Phaeodactylibacter sp.]